MREAIRARVLPAWDEGRPGYGFLLGMYCFALEESGGLRAGRALGAAGGGDEPRRRLVDSRGSRTCWRCRAGCGRGPSGWTGPLEAWGGLNPMREHLWWHLAMFEVERGRHARVLDLYDERIRPEPTDFYLDLQNCASMLWRLECRGVDVGSRWEDLADAERGQGRGSRARLHRAAPRDGPSRGPGRFEEVDRIVESLERCAAERSTYAAGLARRLTIPICQAGRRLLPGGFRPGWRHCSCRSATTTPRWVRVTPSATCSPSFSTRRRFAAGRIGSRGPCLPSGVEQRPDSADSWSKYADALAGCGEEAASADARARAGTCRAAAA